MVTAGIRSAFVLLRALRVLFDPAGLADNCMLRANPDSWYGECLGTSLFVDGNTRNAQNGDNGDSDGKRTHDNTSLYHVVAVF